MSAAAVFVAASIVLGGVAFPKTAAIRMWLCIGLAFFALLVETFA